jgi:hypothetical protein
LSSDTPPLCGDGIRLKMTMLELQNQRNRIDTATRLRSQ